ncbi:hypothetical protein CDL27_15405 [Mediterraneibacter gnavus]|nr:hypothetical protein CDL27_15405 [Mediterraneibacter gnavus]
MHQLPVLHTEQVIFWEVEDESVANVFEGFKKLCIDILSMLRILTYRDHLGMYLVIYKDKHHKAVAE